MIIRLIISLLIIPLIPTILLLGITLLFAGKIDYTKLNLLDLFIRSGQIIYLISWVAMLVSHSLLYFLRKTGISYYMLLGFLIGQSLIILPNIIDIGVIIGLQSLLVGLIGALTGAVFYFIIARKLPRVQTKFILLDKKIFFYILVFISLFYSMTGIIQYPDKAILVIKPYPSVVYLYSINPTYSRNEEDPQQPWYITGGYIHLTTITWEGHYSIFIKNFSISYYLLYLIWIIYIWSWLTRKISKPSQN